MSRTYKRHRMEKDLSPEVTEVNIFPIVTCGGADAHLPTLPRCTGVSTVLGGYLSNKVGQFQNNI